MSVKFIAFNLGLFFFFFTRCIWQVVDGFVFFFLATDGTTSHPNLASPSVLFCCRQDSAFPNFCWLSCIHTGDITPLCGAILWCQPLGFPRTNNFSVWCQCPPSPQPPSHPSARPKMFCWLINSGSLQTSSYDGLSGQELVTEPDLTPAFVWAWPLSWLLNERWRDEPLKNPS